MDVEDILSQKQVEKPLSVSEFLNNLNKKLAEIRVRVQGEVSSISTSGVAIYFSIKDKGGSVLNCLIWKNVYNYFGIELKEGLEIIVEGAPDVYLPTGRLSFKTNVIELVGEGALKDAYEKLKKKLTDEGLFLSERKKGIPNFPVKIGLITSEGGAVIHDYLSNLGHYGFKTLFVDSRVEGQAAITDIIQSIDILSKKDIDVLVLIRGGGSLESLQAFNNEAVVRKLASLKVPLICGIGHDKDVPLACLVADRAVSTPTAVTVILNESWSNARKDLEILEKEILHKYEGNLQSTRSYLNSSLENKMFHKYQMALRIVSNRINNFSYKIERSFNSVLDAFRLYEAKLFSNFQLIGHALEKNKDQLKQSVQAILMSYRTVLDENNRFVLDSEQIIKSLDPTRLLRIGYSIALKEGKVLKYLREVKSGEEIQIRVSDGKFSSTIKKVDI